MDALERLNQILAGMYESYRPGVDYHAVLAFIAPREGFARKVGLLRGEEQADVLNILSAYFIMTKPGLFKGNRIQDIILEQVNAETLDEKEAAVLSALLLLHIRRAFKSKEFEQVLTLCDKQLKYLDRAEETIKGAWAILRYLSVSRGLEVEQRRRGPWIEQVVNAKRAQTYSTMGTTYLIKKDYKNALKYEHEALQYIPWILNDYERLLEYAYTYDIVGGIHKEIAFSLGDTKKMSAAEKIKFETNIARYLEYRCLALDRFRRLKTDEALYYLADEYRFMERNIFQGKMPQKEYIEAYWKRISRYVESHGREVSGGILEQFELFAALKECPRDATTQLMLKALDSYLKVFEKIKKKGGGSEEDKRMLVHLQIICKHLRKASESDEESSKFHEVSKQLAIKLLFGGKKPDNFQQEFEKLLSRIKDDVNNFKKLKGLA